MVSLALGYDVLQEEMEGRAMMDALGVWQGCIAMYVPQKCEAAIPSHSLPFRQLVAARERGRNMPYAPRMPLLSQDPAICPWAREM